MERPAHVKAFIERFKRLAQVVQVIYGIPASVVLAQAALESDWGRGYLAKYGIYFGQTKSGPGPDTVTVEATVNGVVKTFYFKKFSSVYQAAMAYGHNLQTNPAYAKAFLALPDVMKFCDGLKAYDPYSDYPATLKQIIHDFNLTEFDVIFEW